MTNPTARTVTDRTDTAAANVVLALTGPLVATTDEQVAALPLDIPGTVVVVVKNCGHERDYTNTTHRLPSIGEDHACWSSCDHVPTWRGANNPHIRRVARIEVRSADHPAR